MSPNGRPAGESALQRAAQGVVPSEPMLVVGPSWVGDAILAEPLLALIRDPSGAASIDVVAPPWCAPVFARMRGVRRVIENPIAHGRFGLGERRALARRLAGEHYVHAFVLPNSWKSALVPWLAGIPRRTGYVGEMRYGLLNDARRLDAKSLPRLVQRYAALAGAPGQPPPVAPDPVLVPDAANRAAAMASMGLSADRPAAILCPGAEYGPAKRWPAEHFAELAARFLRDGMQVWIVGSPNDKAIAAAVVRSGGGLAASIRDLTGRTDLGTAIDLLSVATVVVSNDSGLMHAAAAVGAPLVALFGSSSPAFTPPLSPRARVARIEIACSPCFKRECPLGHFRCMRDLAPEQVYTIARSGTPLP